jgi:hypothetical protein
METYQVPNGKPYRNWQAVFDDAQPLPWTAFNTGYIYGALKTYAQPDSVPPHRNPTDRVYSHFFYLRLAFVPEVMECNLAHFVLLLDKFQTLFLSFS